ncbi:hypothetical protein BGZ73_000599 [Actinomortierella ambigua]|nr:hypothetical protein BGZ73_000599 [Actinomortierella ambigua]
MVGRLGRPTEEVLSQESISTSQSDELFKQEINAMVDKLLSRSIAHSNSISTTNANALLFIKDMVVFLELCAAIKEGDMGRIGMILRRIAIMLQAGGYTNYAIELLRFEYNIQHVWSPDIRI